jgi:hypothetical protein
MLESCRYGPNATRHARLPETGRVGDQMTRRGRGKAETVLERLRTRRARRWSKSTTNH